MSARLRRSAQAPLEDLKMDMSPMIDMVFLLLIFFMVSAVMIDYKKDKDVEIPIADQARPPDEGISGRIIVNIYNDATAERRGTRFSDEDSNPLDEAGITDHVAKLKSFYDQGNVTPRLHVRGDRGADVEWMKRAVQAAGRAGVVEVIFSTYNNPN